MHNFIHHLGITSYGHVSQRQTNTRLTLKIGALVITFEGSGSPSALQWNKGSSQVNSIKQPRDSNTKPRKGNLTMDPLLPMIPSGTRLPIGFKKIQYLIKLALL